MIELLSDCAVVIGTILVFSSLILLWHTFKGSRNPFVFTTGVFIYLYGVYYIFWGLLEQLLLSYYCSPLESVEEYQTCLQLLINEHYYYFSNIYDLPQYYMMPSYCTLSIQTWIFGMKYIKSVINFQQSTRYYSTRCVTIIEYTFILIFIAIFIWFSIFMKRKTSLNGYQFDSQFYYHIYYTWIVWVGLSTIVTLCGMCMLIKVVNDLKAKNKNLKFNSLQIGLHFLMLVFQVFIYGFLTQPSLKRGVMNIYVIVGDFFVQMLICYICWTQGSSSQLRRFECVIVDGYVYFKLKK